MTFRTSPLRRRADRRAPAPALAASADNWRQRHGVIALPVLRANVAVTCGHRPHRRRHRQCRPGRQIAIYRAPDLGTTGSLPTAQVIAALRAHQVIGVDTRDIKQVTVTRLARNVESKDIQESVAHALEHRSGLGDAANLSLTFDRDIQDLHLDASNTGAMQPTRRALRAALHGRFDVTFEIANDERRRADQAALHRHRDRDGGSRVLTRNVERTDLLKSSDLMVERRPKAEIGGDAALRDRALGMQMRRPMRAGQALKVADLVKPDLVQRDQGVTLIFQTAGHLSHHPRQGGRQRHRGRRGQRAQSCNPSARSPASSPAAAR